MSILVNGRQGELVSVRDRGLAYGDGVFRTLRCEGGRLLAWPRHYAKLLADCAVLGLACPAESALLADIGALAPFDAVVKITITRGVGARGYAADPAADVTRIVQIAPLPQYDAALFERGAALHACDWPLGLQPRLAGVKHLNRLDQVMARREWQDPAIFDGLMLNLRGEVVEGLISNVFALQGDVLSTHPLKDCGVAGVARDIVLSLADRMDWRIELQPLSMLSLQAADGIFLTNSLAGVVPVAQIGEMSRMPPPALGRLRHFWSELVHLESVACPIA